MPQHRSTMVLIALFLLCNPLFVCTLCWRGALYFALQLLPVVLAALGFLICLLTAFYVYSACLLKAGKALYLELMSYRFRRTGACMGVCMGAVRFLLPTRRQISKVGGCVLYAFFWSHTEEFLSLIYISESTRPY